MCFDNRRRGCGICRIFHCFCGGGRRRFNDRCDCRHRFDDRCGRRVPERRAERALTRADFAGFFPEAKFITCERRCRC